MFLHLYQHTKAHSRYGRVGCCSQRLKAPSYFSTRLSANTSLRVLCKHIDPIPVKCRYEQISFKVMIIEQLCNQWGCYQDLFYFPRACVWGHIFLFVKVGFSLQTHAKIKKWKLTTNFHASWPSPMGFDRWWMSHGLQGCLFFVNHCCPPVWMQYPVKTNVWRHLH